VWNDLDAGRIDFWYEHLMRSDMESVTALRVRCTDA
jgi:hypothetical protein